MDKIEKTLFIKSILDSVADSLIKNIDIYPEEWDGVELRWLIADHVADNVVIGSAANKKRRRFKDYRHTVIVENL